MTTATPRATPADSGGTGQPRPKRELAARIGLWILVIAAGVYALTIAVFGVTGIAVQAASGTAVMTLQSSPPAEGGFGAFTSVGVGGAIIPGTIETVSVAVDGLSSLALVMKAAGDLLGVLAQVALALGAYQLGRALLGGRPFTRTLSRTATLTATALLVIGVGGQLVDWAARVIVLKEMGSAAFSRAFAFEPLLLTVGLALGLFAATLRYGERLQRDTEGLV
jgi:hypothetical protein